MPLQLMHCKRNIIMLSLHMGVAYLSMTVFGGAIKIEWLFPFLL